MKQQLKNFLEDLKNDTGMQNKLRNVQSEKDLIKIVTPYLDGMSVEDFLVEYSELTKELLSNNELSNISGGQRTDSIATRKSKAKKKAGRNRNYSLGSDLVGIAANLGTTIGAEFVEDPKVKSAVLAAGNAVNQFANSFSKNFAAKADYYDDKVSGLDDGTWDE